MARPDEVLTPGKQNTKAQVMLSRRKRLIALMCVAILALAGSGSLYFYLTYAPVCKPSGFGDIRLTTNSALHDFFGVAPPCALQATV